MELFDFIKILGHNKKILALSVFLFVIVAAGLTFVQPLQYSAKSRLLIVQDNGSVLDPYSSSKANEYLSNVLTNVIVSTSFYEEVISSGFNIDIGYFTKTPGQLAKKWQKTVEAKSVGDLGLIEVTVYQSDKYQLDQIAQAINYTIKAKNGQYHNSGDKVSIKVIDEPVFSGLPVRPNIILNFILAIFLGFVFGFLWIYLRAINALNLTEASHELEYELQSMAKPPVPTPSPEVAPVGLVTSQVMTPNGVQRPPVEINSVKTSQAEEGNATFSSPAPTKETIDNSSTEAPEAEEEEIFDGDIKNIYGFY